MKVVIGSDHAGFRLKEEIIAYLKQLGYEPIDIGTYNEDPVDYPDYARGVGLKIISGDAERGILICGSGVGASVAANKIPGVRAGLCHDTYSAHQGVEHDDMNILVLGARVIGIELAKELTRSFLNASFTGAPRHKRRLQKIKDMESSCFTGDTPSEGGKR